MSDDLMRDEDASAYVAIDRDEVRRSLAALADENFRVRSFLASELGSRDEVAAAMRDRDWISGYGAGLEDAQRESRGLPASGPGTSSESGWGRGQVGIRAEGYYAGLADGRSPPR
jgi:hypothetical protein